MGKNKGKEQTYHSINEFEKRFFPKSFKRRLVEDIKDAQTLGTNLAKESLRKIKVELPE